jgi:hypothetical protein
LLPAVITDVSVLGPNRADDLNGGRMRRYLVVLLILVSAAGCTFAMMPGYETGKLVNAREATDVQVYWQFVVQVRDQLYVAEYRPLVPWNFDILSDFTINGPVKVRISGKNVYLARPFGKDLRLKVRLHYVIDDERQLAAFRPQRPEYTLGGGR